ncbi:MAG: 16S rRNA (guanine(966)-N(2))-methyltransferase RsmD [Clostridiales Family XIII bacterium]|jgi:16S rRNA (guanine(966)-N(2))-methyltransferase RsmD|nr:16S rRNA (guanine(966)-N(2))-methyltransferase RsmD [Clostridiales Family XIII bacterium]
MRVISGRYKGRKIDAPQGRELRPTSEKVKEALFSMIASIMAPVVGGDAPLEDMTCLDLFAGTGALGIEALSRGARSCVFAEVDPSAARVLEGNVGRIVNAGGMGLPTTYTRVLKSDWRVALRRLDGGIDIAFVDPPYESGYYDEVMKTFLEYGIISDGGLVALERAYSGNSSQNGAGRRVRGGMSRIDFIETGQVSLFGRYEGFELIRERRYGKTLVEVYKRVVPGTGRLR